jgi:hypothetical protein
MFALRKCQKQKDSYVRNGEKGVWKFLGLKIYPNNNNNDTNKSENATYRNKFDCVPEMVFLGREKNLADTS